MPTHILYIMEHDRPVREYEEGWPFERVPEELKEYPQWVNWYVDSEQKIPLNPLTLGHAGVTWPNTWVPFAQAFQTAQCNDLGLGFVLTEDDPYTCVDLDKCVEARGKISAATRAILDLVSGWVELSPSGTGLHIWVKNEQPVNRRTKGIEIYSSKRWMSITGRSNPKQLLRIPDRTAEIVELLEGHFPNTSASAEFVPPPHLPDDAEIWQRLLHGRNSAFFAALYQGDTSVCHHDHSRAVIMLANQLAYMTNGDAVRMRHLLYQTGLVCEKWAEKRGQQTWIDYQIQDAISYVGGKQE